MPLALGCTRGGKVPADPGTSLLIDKEYARYFVALSGESYQVKANPNPILQIIAFARQGVSSPELLLEVGLGKQRPYRRVMPGPRKEIRPRSCLSGDITPEELRTIIRVLHKVWDSEVENKYRRCYRYAQQSVRFSRYWVDYHRNGSVAEVPARVWDRKQGKEIFFQAYRHGRCLRGVTISVDRRDRKLLDFLYNIECEWNPFLERTMQKFARINGKILDARAKGISYWLGLKPNSKFTFKAIRELRKMWSNGGSNGNHRFLRTDILARFLTISYPGVKRSIIFNGDLLLSFLVREGVISFEQKQEIAERMIDKVTNGMPELWKKLIVYWAPNPTAERLGYEVFRADWASPLEEIIRRKIRKLRKEELSFWSRFSKVTAGGVQAGVV